MTAKGHEPIAHVASLLGDTLDEAIVKSVCERHGLKFIVRPDWLFKADYPVLWITSASPDRSSILSVIRRTRSDTRYKSPIAILINSERLADETLSRWISEENAFVLPVPNAQRHHKLASLLDDLFRKLRDDMTRMDWMDDMTRIEMWPVFDCGVFRLEDGRLRRGGVCDWSILDGGWARNTHLRGFLAALGDWTMLGRLTRDDVAAALGFGLNEWEADVRHGIQLTEDEWETARRTKGVARR